MKIDATTFAKLPEHLQALFDKAPNPGRDEVLAGFPQTAASPSIPVKQGGHHRHDVGLSGATREGFGVGYGDKGSAARFFYCAKASKKDRDEGMDGFELNYVARENGFSDKLSDTKKPRANNHPTVKPSDLMAYLCRLVTPPGGIVLDPFMGSGSTGKAAMREGFDFIGIEKDAGYFAIAQRRIEQAQQQLFAGVAA